MEWRISLHFIRWWNKDSDECWVCWVLVGFGAIGPLHCKCSGTIGSMLLLLLVTDPWVHLGCDLWPNGDLSINYDISNSEAGCVVSLILQRAGEMFSFPEPSEFSRREIFYRSGFGRYAVFRDLNDESSKSSLTSGSSLLAMDDLTLLLSPSGAASLIPEIRMQSARGQLRGANLVLFSSCSERSGQWGRGLGTQGGPQMDELGPEWLGIDYSADWLVFNQG